jgi:hypothetical protein
MPSASSSGDVLREADAAGAEHATLVVQHDARPEIDGLGLVNLAPRRSWLAGLAVLHGVFLQLALAGLVADRAVERMVDEQRFQHGLAHLLTSRANARKFPCPARSAMAQAMAPRGVPGS